MHSDRSPRLLQLGAAALVALLVAWAPATAPAQPRLERDGVVLYWGLVPAAVVSQRHALDEMHGVLPADGGQNHHLVVAIFDGQGRRIEQAVVRAQLHEVGIADATPKTLTPMTIDGKVTYGQVFSTSKAGPYRFRLLVRLPGRDRDLEFAGSVWSPHREVR